jgi:hypothetical protein
LGRLLLRFGQLYLLDRDISPCHRLAKYTTDALRSTPSAKVLGICS